MTIAVTDTRRQESTSVRAAGLPLCLGGKLTKEDPGSWGMFQRLILEIRIKIWRQVNTKYRKHATVRDVFHAIETSAFEFVIRHQDAG
ncbi:MAG: hypothetical protein K2X43_01840 [Hyphomonadaceae bacterium]|nr:hypothetical protein [Hyphomonadaceae bacterium]